MADTQPVDVSTPAAAISAAPATTSSVPETPVVSTPVAEITPSAAEPVVSAPAAQPDKSGTAELSATDSVLGDSGKTEVKTDVKAETKTEEKIEAKDTVKAEGEKPEGEVKIEFPIYEEFKVPEGVNLDKEQVGEFNKILGEIETGKLDHAGYQAAGQKLVDLATKATTDSITRLNDYYVNFHENQKKQWFEAFKADPEMGGEKLDITVGTLREAVETYAGNESQVQEFRQLMKETGVGNHPSVIRLLNNMANKISKYTTEADNGNGGNNRMVPGARPAPSKVKDYQRFYAGGS